jgi:tRNA pseudouridine55 synthase
VFSGKINQAPPVVSAIKINGKISYALARKGLAVPLLAREVEISLIKLGFISDSQLSYQIDCSKGTYIRSLARDIGRYLGTFGTLESIRREKIGSFKLEDAISLDELLKLDEVQPQLIQIETMVEDLPRIYLDSASCTWLKQGKQEILRDLILNPNDKFVAVFNEQNSLVCTLEQSNNEGFSGWKIARVI